MSHLCDDDDDGGDWQSSVSSPAASSSFSSGRRWSDVDFRDYPLQSEVEEIPSFRWLMTERSRPVPKPLPTVPPSEVDWGHLISDQGKHRLKQVTANNWVVLVEGGAIEERCAIVLAPGLQIKWRDGDSSCWRYRDGAAVLRKACWLDIRAKMDAADLFPKTAYVSVLVFQLLPAAFGLGLDGETQETWIAVGDRLVSERTVSLQPGQGGELAGGPRRRRDGWLEIELGEFSAVTYAGKGEALVEMGLWEVERLGQEKGGLVVRGVEVRPKHLGDAGKGNGTVRVYSPSFQWDLPELDAQPIDLLGSWMLSCWLAPLATTRLFRLSGSESFPDRILQCSYADWKSRDLDTTPSNPDPESNPKPKTENRSLKPPRPGQTGKRLIASLLAASRLSS